VAHVIVDGVIDIPRTKGYHVNEGVADGKISPDAVSYSISFSEPKTGGVSSMLMGGFAGRLPKTTGICIRSIVLRLLKSWI